MDRVFAFDAVLHEEPDGGAYIIFPYDIRREFGKGRVKTHAEFDGIPYDGSIVNMGVTDESGNICYILGVLKSIRKKLGIVDGDTIRVRISVPMDEAAKEIAPWICPRCGRAFQKREQSHYCEKPQTIDAYIDGQDAAVQPRLRELRAILRGALPEAEERISWSMPTYWKGRNIIHFAAAQKHVGLYPGGEAANVFAEELKGFDVSKGTIRIPWSAELPAALIARIARWCLEAYGK